MTAASWSWFSGHVEQSGVHADAAAGHRKGIDVLALEDLHVPVLVDVGLLQLLDDRGRDAVDVGAGTDVRGRRCLGAHLLELLPGFGFQLGLGDDRHRAAAEPAGRPRMR